MRFATFVALLGLTAACNPFEANRGAEGQPCHKDGSCDEGLECLDDLCTPFICPTEPPCEQPGLEGQGADGDGDGWGRCCDCEDSLGSIYPGAPERCDDWDNDCDGATDEGDACPLNCVDNDLDGYGRNCAAGEDCDDRDGDVHPGAEEECNGIDDDCDGQTDEDIVDRDCPIQAGVCLGTQQACEPGVGWGDCGPDHTPGEDTRCDGLDNDCDGETDEEALILEPESGAQAVDGVDNNCNGLIDEAGGVMVPLSNYPGRWVDAYETTVFENPDCTGTRYGEAADDYPVEWPAQGDASVDLYACSLPGLVPSGHLSWYRADRACVAQGKRLCSMIEWGAGCTGGQGRNFPYGPQFTPGACNDMLGGSGQADGTGERIGCTAGAGTYDMSGNLEEWVQTGQISAPEYKLRGGGGYMCELCEVGQACRACDPGSDFDQEEIRELSDCYIDHDETSASPPEWAKAWYGGRCCYEP